MQLGESPGGRGQCRGSRGKLHEGGYCRGESTALRCLGSTPQPSECLECHTAEGEGGGLHPAGLVSQAVGSGAPGRGLCWAGTDICAVRPVNIMSVSGKAPSINKD